MEVINNNLVELKGCIGDLVYYRRNGKIFVRKRPKKRSKPISEKQQVGINKIKSTTSLYRSLKSSMIPYVWKRYAIDKDVTGYNLFIKTNSKAFDANGKLKDHSLLFLSKGKVDLPHLLKASYTTSNTLEIKWEQTDFYKKDTREDRLFLLFFYNSKNFKKLFLTDTNTTRENGCFEMKFTEDEEKPIHLYCFFGTGDNLSFSDSKYFNLDSGKVE